MSPRPSSSAIACPANPCHRRAARFPAEARGNKRESMLEAIDPSLRLVFCCGFALAVVGLARFPSLLAALAVAGFAAATARLEPARTLRRMAALDGFMLFVLLLLPLAVPGEAMFSFGGIDASREGALRSAEIVLKSNAVVLMILALLGSMEAVELGRAMMRLRLPSKFVYLFLFTVRYIAVLDREYRRLRAAMKVRGFRMRCDAHTWRSVGYLFGMLLVRGLERSERVLAAMRCRGFQGRFPPPVEAKPLDRRDRAFAGLSTLACCALMALERW